MTDEEWFYLDCLWFANYKQQYTNYKYKVENNKLILIKPKDLIDLNNIISKELKNITRNLSINYCLDKNYGYILSRINKKFIDFRLACKQLNGRTNIL